MPIYGVANQAFTPAVWAPASDVTLTSSTETLAITTTSALKGNPGQSYTPVIIGCAAIVLGGTAPSALVLAARYSGGSDVATQTVPVGALVNSAVLMVPVCLVMASVDAAGDGTIGGAAIEITGDPTGQAATWKKVGTALSILFLPGGAS
jgi:hypothetical protein